MSFYSVIKFWLRAYELTYATVSQDPHEFIINTEWKTATPQNDRKQGPVIPTRQVQSAEN